MALADFVCLADP